MNVYFPLFLSLLCFSLFSCQQASPESFHDNNVIAHRGAWKKAGHPQNSIASLREAIRLGCEGSEFDVWMTADSILVVNHDADFMGLPIETSTLEQLYEKELSNGEKIPTAAEYLKEGIKQKKTKLIYEAKPSELGRERNFLIAQKSVELVKSLKASEWVDYISFDKDICRKIMELDPDAQVAYLNGEKSPEQLAENGYFGFDYHISIVKKNSHWITEAHQLGLTVNAWTVNDSDDMKWLLDHGTDFITTDEPEMLLEIVQNRN
ncbi:glycerophosphodiester phosphodiesterase [Litoribacter populi]|uniref:glycerophosphodiester phosphodiesterase n=1 Tax=Litoribacter populi TaxID=2598460 RepID=UPI00118172D3|nr:glycerophosphodiester phosphodiesterase family protein [Litoribacter populi]